MRLHMAAVLTGAVLAAGSLTACSDWNQANGHGDAVIGQVDNSGAEIINMPDTFGNLASKCSHGFRVWSTTHGSGDDMHEYSAQIWVEKDPSCVPGAVK